jgi:hypothetical protein
MVPTGSSSQRTLVKLALVVLPVAAFAPGLTSPLTHYDDPLYLGRPELTMPQWEGLWQLWSGESAWNARFLEYFPLRDSVYWLIFRIWGNWATPYHLTSLFLHVLAGVLVFRLLEKLGQSFWVASAAALLWAVHPIHIESVVWVAALKDPLYVCFVLGSLILYSDYRTHQKASSYAAVIGLLVCALLVKSMALSTPLIMLAIERWIGAPTRWRLIVARLGGPAVICALFLVQFVLIGRLNFVPNYPHQGNWTSHLVLASWAQVIYLRQVFLPSSFRLIYCFLPVESLWDVRLLAGVVSMSAIAGLCLFWRRMPLRLFCVSFYFASLLPVSNLVPFPAVVADRYLYAASFGACFLIALLLEPARSRLRNTVVVLVVATFAVTTALRTWIWRNEESLWEDIDDDPVCVADPEFPAADAHYLRFLTSKDNGTKLQALKRLLTTRGSGDSFGLRCEALLTGAQLLVTAGDYPEAEHWTKLAIPDCKKHPRMWSTALTVTAHRNLPVAATAAQRWHGLDPTPVTNLFRMLTQLELKDEAARREEVLGLVKVAPEVCPTLQLWSTEVTPAVRQPIGEALKACEAADAGTRDNSVPEPLRAAP